MPILDPIYIIYFVLSQFIFGSMQKLVFFNMPRCEQCMYLCIALMRIIVRKELETKGAWGLKCPLLSNKSVN